MACGSWCEEARRRVFLHRAVTRPVPHERSTTGDDPMKLYTFAASPVCRPVAMFIADHGIKVEEQTVDLMKGEQNQPWFLAINPSHAVPVLQDGDFVLTESSAILK